jgi:hypothetical protein
MLEVGFQATHGWQRRLSASQRVEPPQQQVGAVNHGRASLRPAREDGVNTQQMLVQMRL